MPGYEYDRDSGLLGRGWRLASPTGVPAGGWSSPVSSQSQAAVARNLELNRLNPNHPSAIAAAQQQVLQRAPNPLLRRPGEAYNPGEHAALGPYAGYSGDANLYRPLSGGALEGYLKQSTPMLNQQGPEFQGHVAGLQAQRREQLIGGMNQRQPLLPMQAYQPPPRNATVAQLNDWSTPTGVAAPGGIGQSAEDGRRYLAAHSQSPNVAQTQQAAAPLAQPPGFSPGRGQGIFGPRGLPRANPAASVALAPPAIPPAPRPPAVPPVPARPAPLTTPAAPVRSPAMEEALRAADVLERRGSPMAAAQLRSQAAADEPERQRLAAMTRQIESETARNEQIIRHYGPMAAAAMQRGDSSPDQLEAMGAMWRAQQGMAPSDIGGDMVPPMPVAPSAPVVSASPVTPGESGEMPTWQARQLLGGINGQRPLMPDYGSLALPTDKGGSPMSALEAAISHRYAGLNDPGSQISQAYRGHLSGMYGSEAMRQAGEEPSWLASWWDTPEAKRRRAFFASPKPAPEIQLPVAPQLSAPEQPARRRWSSPPPPLASNGPYWWSPPSMATR